MTRSDIISTSPNEIWGEYDCAKSLHIEWVLLHNEHHYRIVCNELFYRCIEVNEPSTVRSISNQRFEIVIC